MSVEPAIPAIVFYTRAVAWPDGSARFYDDVHGHDRLLERELRGLTGPP